MSSKIGPDHLVIHGFRCYRTGRPMEMSGQTWDTYIPVLDEYDEYDDDRPEFIWERSRETGRIVLTQGA